MLMSDAGLSPMAPVDVPDGYPRDLEQWVDLADGDRIFVRPMIPEDVARIQYAFEHADIDSVRRRFFTAAPPSDRAHMEYMATVDFDRRLALLAMDDQGNSIGVARYEQESEGEAEIAIVVDDENTAHGLPSGSALLSALGTVGRRTVARAPRGLLGVRAMLP